LGYEFERGRSVPKIPVATGAIVAVTVIVPGESDTLEPIEPTVTVTSSLSTAVALVSVIDITVVFEAVVMVVLEKEVAKVLEVLPPEANVKVTPVGTPEKVS
jgi:hypothetical protein